MPGGPPCGALPLEPTKRVCHARRRQRSRAGLSGRASGPPSACYIRLLRWPRTFRILHSGDGDRPGIRAGAHNFGLRPTPVGIGHRETRNALHRRQELGGNEIAPCSGPEHQHVTCPSQSLVEIGCNPLATRQIAACCVSV
ncbi:hypothetical protein RGR602_PC00526 (plasmid) [Rhizobium gallicum bv. gallicum R602sp]|uniref:Uncharacterized protein n=1 Tax=Rhizobium gallicum bv. gallicum R602sp TaxID=1041138 RepID=A0A0B4XBU5_9HYPH|nr:hypothetical protein RGR602_PC00526 [Rhizobium gallicum bv. gallicum R602sp]